ANSHAAARKGIRKLIPVFRRGIPAVNEVNSCPGNIQRPEKFGPLLAGTPNFESFLLNLSEQALFARNKKTQNDKPNGSQTG
ncbi:uncharacterized protein METZ01_LOCUS320350, partial [marine metagenome]